VPTLRDVLDLVGGRVPLLVEPKSTVLWPALERAVLAALDGYAGDVAIQSFKRRTVLAIGRSDAPHAVGHLWHRAGLLPTPGLRVAFLGCHVDALPSRAVRRMAARLLPPIQIGGGVCHGLGKIDTRSSL